MLLNYLKLALRLLARSPFFTFINIFGLSVGVATFYILWQYAQFELKSDQFHRDYNSIVRFGNTVRYYDAGETVKNIGFQHLEVARRIRNDYSEIEDLTRIINQQNFKWGSIPFHKDNVFISTQKGTTEKIGFAETKVAYGDANLFTFFTLPLVKGSAKDVLAKPYSIVISEHIAKKYFGNDDPLGRILSINDSVDFTVTGVYKDLPHNTHLDFEMVISSLSVGTELYSMNVKNLAGHCYYKLKHGTGRITLEAKLNQAKEKYWGEVMRQIDGGGNLSALTFYLQPISEVAFSVFSDDYFVAKSKITLTVLAGVGIVILIMAWINYLNLTLSLNHRRMKEFAARKTLGAKPGDLIVQFMTESILINSLAVLFAFTLVQLIKQPLEIQLGFYIPDWRETSYESLTIILPCIGSGILLTGLYPAILTYRRSPKSLFGSINMTGQKTTISQWLTITQYVSAAVLIVWTFAIVLQLNFMLNKTLGINTDNVITIDMPLSVDYTSKNLEGFTHDLEQIKDVADFAVSRNVAGDDPLIDAWLRSEGKDFMGGGGLTNGGVDERFLPFYKIKLLAGRNFLPDSPADEHNVLVDMNAIGFLGIKDPQDAIGREVLLQDHWPDNVWHRLKIIGVIETFSLRPLSQRFIFKTGEKDANVLTYKHLREQDAPRKIAVRLQGKNVHEVVRFIEQSFHKTFPGEVFNWYFLDDHIKRHYSRDKFARNQILFMTGLAICIACLGLLGMMANQVTIKTKELGIRKVLGAQLHQLGSVLLKSSLYHVALAVGIALPVAHFLVKAHLDNFIERITLQWWHYAIPIVILLLILFMTIASTLLRAVKINPVDSLRYE